MRRRGDGRRRRRGPGRRDISRDSQGRRHHVLSPPTRQRPSGSRLPPPAGRAPGRPDGSSAAAAAPATARPPITGRGGRRRRAPREKLELVERVNSNEGRIFRYLHVGDPIPCECRPDLVLPFEVEKFVENFSIFLRQGLAQEQSALCRHFPSSQLEPSFIELIPE